MILKTIKKRLIIYISIIGILLLLCVSYFFTWGTLRNKEKMFVGVDSISIINGNNGGLIEVSDQTEINKILSYFQNIKYFRKIEFMTGGYDYYMDFYNDEEVKHRIYFMGSKIQVDKKHYWMKDENEISLDELVLSLRDTN